MTDKIAKLAKKAGKLEGRTEYIKATGYEVELTVQYKRIRRVRAMNEDQAREFAVAREATFAPNYFNVQNHGKYKVTDIEATNVEVAAKGEVVE